MTRKHFSDPLTSNDTYYFLVTQPNQEYMVEVFGTFGSATATLGYLTQDDVFTAYPDVNPMTAGAAILAYVPTSGRLALQVSGASGTNITVTADILTPCD